jgi:D-arabinose 5-phosphate isomerase GutQ
MSTKFSKPEILHIARQVINQESQALLALMSQLDDSFCLAVQMILSCHGHVLTSGAGTSNPVAARFAHLLSCCGTPALFIHPGDSQHGLSGAITKKDVLFCISKGGETTETNHLARIAKNRGAKLISILEVSDSTLGKLSDIVLNVKVPSESDPYGMIATGSSLANAVMCDALCVVLLEMRGYSKEQFGETHPGGAVGRKLKGVNP